ncbi:MAG: aminomethyltransferase family protein, partial [Acidobacteriota bacterium]
ALPLLQSLTATALDEIKYYWFSSGTVADTACLITRTGYTGEDGFELYCDPSDTVRLWERIIEAGQAYGILPCGLAARNTLRLEAKMALYGHEIDDQITVLEADLAWICKLDKPDFIGRDRLLAQRAEGVRRRLVGFEVIDKGIARDHYPVIIDGEPAGFVTSGSPAPYLKKNIGLAMLPIEKTAIGTRFEIDVRGRRLTAEVVATPFYKRPR